MPSNGHAINAQKYPTCGSSASLRGPKQEGNGQMSSILKYLVIGTAMLALSLSVACKDDASPAAQEASAGAEAGAKAGAQEGVEAGMEEGAKEGAKEGGKAAGEAAATEVVN